MITEIVKRKVETRKKRRKPNFNVAFSNENGNLNLYITMDKNHETKKEQPVFVSFKKLIFDWFCNLNAYGIPKIFRNENPFFRIVWIICFIASFIYCSYTVIQLLQNYYSNPSYISTEIVQEVCMILDLKTYIYTFIIFYFLIIRYQHNFLL